MINTIFNTKELVRLFASDKQIKNFLKGKKLGSGDKNNIVSRANKLCKLESLGKGNFIIYEIYDNVCLEKFNNHPLYSVYYGMKQRCYNPKEPVYRYYGARGITICDEWLDNKLGIRNFIKWSEENGYIPNEGLSIDRKNTNGNYEPDNCRWVTQDIQLLNRRNSKKDGSHEESRIEQYNGLYLTNLYFNGYLYPVGTFTNKNDAIKAKNNLRCYLVDLLLNEKDSDIISG